MNISRDKNICFCIRSTNVARGKYIGPLNISERMRVEI